MSGQQHRDGSGSIRRHKHRPRLQCRELRREIEEELLFLSHQVTTSSLTRSLQAENASVTDFLEEMNLNVTAFDSLGSLMSSLGGDDVELEEYFSLLFNNSEAVSLLALSVGGDSQAQQAVIDSLETNSEVRGSRSWQAED